MQVTGDNVSAIDTDSPTISGTFTADDANNLPVNTRASFGGTSAANILGTLPGVQADASGISLQGALPYQVEVTVDGVTLKNPSGGSYIGDAFPSTESISEIRADGVMANGVMPNAKNAPALAIKLTTARRSTFALRGRRFRLLKR